LDAEAAETLHRISDAALLIDGGWSVYSLWRAVKKGRVRFVRGPALSVTGKPLIHVPASEIRRLNALQAGRPKRGRTTPFIPPLEP
jgi:hypothetical protein